MDFNFWFVCFWPVGYLVGIPIYIKVVKSDQTWKIMLYPKLLLVILLFVLHRSFFQEYPILFGSLTGVVFGTAFSHIGLKKLTESNKTKRKANEIKK